MKILKSPLLSPLQLNPSFSASLSWKSYLTIRWPTRPRQRVCGRAQPLHKSYNPCMMLTQMLRKATHFLFHAKCKFFFCIFNKWKEICITSFKKKKRQIFDCNRAIFLKHNNNVIFQLSKPTCKIFIQKYVQIFIHRTLYTIIPSHQITSLCVHILDENYGYNCHRSSQPSWYIVVQSPLFSSMIHSTLPANSTRVR